MNNNNGRGIAWFALCLAAAAFLVGALGNAGVFRVERAGSRALCMQVNNLTYVTRRALKAAKVRAAASVPNTRQRAEIVAELDAQIALLVYDPGCPHRNDDEQPR